jgi:hypothetical protein
MSRSSAYLAGKKSRHGTQEERKRARTMYIMKTQSEKMAEMVAAKVKQLIVEEVSRELDRRGYRNRKDGGSTTEMSPQEERPPNQEVDETVDEA